ncbi:MULTISPECIES: SAF domain-containing protein [Bacteria]
MTALDSPARRPRAFWNDVRFFVGLGLIVASVAGVWATVTAARQTVPVFAAARTIVPGDEVTADDLRLVEASLGAAEGVYLSPDALNPGSIATRTVTEGELVPVNALEDGVRARVTTVVVQTTTAVPSDVVAGSVVELWASPVLEQGVFGTPAILVADATVGAVDEADSLLGARGSTLELVVPRSDVAAVLQAVAASSALSIVPGAGGA